MSGCPSVRMTAMSVSPCERCHLGIDLAMSVCLVWTLWSLNMIAEISETTARMNAVISEYDCWDLGNSCLSVCPSVWIDYNVLPCL